MLNPWMIALLSTDYDLRDYREAVIKKLTIPNIKLSAFEEDDFPVEPNQHSYDNCLIALDRIDIAILIIDKRYGGIYDKSKQISITEKEYSTVIQAGKPCLVFVSKKTWDERHVYDENRNASGKEKTEFDKDYKCTYVDNINIFHFVNSIRLSQHDNWITSFDGIPDLIKKIDGQLKGLSRYYTQKIMEAQVKDISGLRTSTSSGMSLDDVFNKNYYIEPNYKIDSGRLCLGDDPFDSKLVATVKLGTSILVHGEAGYGKTTILAKSFLSHADKISKEKSYNIPLYLLLKKKTNSYHFDFKKYISECFEENLNKTVYPFFETTSLQPCFYFDGFDEIAEKLSLVELDMIANSDIFKYPLLLTCRTQYASRYINNYNFTNKFSSRVKVETWDEVKAKAYIDNFYRAQGKDEEYSNEIHTLLSKNQELSEILNNPLVITMLLFIIDTRKINLKMFKSKIELLTGYLNEIANREIHQLGIQSLSEINIVQIWAYFAWMVHENEILKNQSKMNDLLNKLQKDILPDLGDDYNASLFESVFDTHQDKIFGVLHEQFLEFLVARALFDACLKKVYPYPEFLKYVMRPEINRYFRALWEDCSTDEKSIVTSNIHELYLKNLGDNSDGAVATRVHAIYHISRFKTNSQNNMIDKAFQCETNIAVKLSLFFGAIKNGRLDYEKTFFELLTSSKEYNIANRGYHLTYYADMSMGDSLPFLDDEKSCWQGTLKAFRRHFESDNIEHYYLRRIDLVTMLHLIESRNSVASLTKDELNRFSELTYNSIHSPDADFQKGVEEAFERVKEKYESFIVKKK